MSLCNTPSIILSVPFQTPPARFPLSICLVVAQLALDVALVVSLAVVHLAAPEALRHDHLDPASLPRLDAHRDLARTECQPSASHRHYSQSAKTGRGENGTYQLRVGLSQEGLHLLQLGLVGQQLAHSHGLWPSDQAMPPYCVRQKLSSVLTWVVNTRPRNMHYLGYEAGGCTAHGERTRQRQRTGLRCGLSAP